MSSLPESTPPFHSRGRAAIGIVGVLVALLLAWLLLRSRETNMTPPPAPAPVHAESVAPIPNEPPPSPRVESSPEPAPVPAEPEKPAELRVVGRVLDGDKEAPLAGAQIELADIVWKNGTHESRSKSETVSGADGSFAFDAVPPSWFWLSVGCEGYTRERLRVDVQELPRSSVGEGASVSAGDIRLFRGSHLRLRAIEASTDVAVAGASLYLLDGVMASDRRALSFLGRTGEHGELDVAERVSIRGEATTLLALGEDGLGLLSLATGDRLATEREFVIPIQAGADFLVRVRDDHGAPLEGANVGASTYAFPIGPATLGVDGVLDLSRTHDEGGRLQDRFHGRTNANGEARLHGLLALEDPRGYRLGASKDGYTGEGIDKQQPEREPTAKEITLVPRKTTTRLAGTVRTEDGSQLPAVTVRCGGRSTAADPVTGHYELSHLDFSTIGANQIEATAAGWAIERTYCKSSGQDPCVQDLTLFRAGEIRGVVLDDAGAPAAGVAVYYRPYAEGGRRASGGAPAEPRATLTDGRFVIRGVRHGEYELEAESQEMRQMFSAGPLPVLKFPKVVASAGDTDVRIRGWRDCSTKGSIHAIVVDARTRAPVDIASATLAPPGENFSVSRPRPSSFTIRIGELDIPSVSVGRWGLWVIATNGGVGFTAFETTEQAPSATIEVRVADERRLSGRLVAAEGATRPPTWEGVRVLARRRNDWQEPVLWGKHYDSDAPTRAQADGSFAFDGLLPGRYVLHAQAGNLHGMMTVEFVEPESKTVEFVLAPPSVAAIAIEAPIELFDGLTMLRYWEKGEVLDDFPLKADVAGQNRRTIRVEPGSFRIQASRRANATEKSEPKSFFFDESFELKADETRTLTLSSPR